MSVVVAVKKGKDVVVAADSLMTFGSNKKYSFVNDQCDEKDSPFGGLDASFLIVTKKHIFHVSGNMTVTEFLKFHAIGSGCDFAIGAMHVLHEQSLDAGEIARRAVEAAIEHNIYCGGEIMLLEP